MTVTVGSGSAGLSVAEARRLLVANGPNVLPQRSGHRWWRDLVKQFTHPLALLLWCAAALAIASGSLQVGIAVLAVILLNALLAFAQERQAEHSVEALGRYLPQHAWVVRDGQRRQVLAAELVVGDLLLIDEGDRVSADARVVDGVIEVDNSALTGESVPVTRGAGVTATTLRRLDSPVLVFSGTVCTGGTAKAVVERTGEHTELGRIAALSQQVKTDDSPLERQVRRVAWLIAAVAVGAGVAFLPLGLLAGLSLASALLFAIGLLVANVPEGLLPTITLALAAGVRAMARRGAVVKKLSAVETLGSTTVICTDKTGTLTANSMRVLRARPATPELAEILFRCNTAAAQDDGDPTETALLRYARSVGVFTSVPDRDRDRLMLNRFDPRRKMMSTVDGAVGAAVVNVKGAPEAVFRCCVGDVADGRRDAEELAEQGLRVLAVASKPWTGAELPDQDGAEAGLRLVGVVGLLDPPRPQVAAAVASVHAAGIRIHVVTGDNGRTAAEIAREVGIGANQVVDGDVLDAMSTQDLDRVLAGTGEIVFARATPETKLRIADALRHRGEVVAMTGDGVNDAPALRRADIGVAMGASGTDVAREAATLVLTDDNFATITAGIEEGRRVFDNVRKFILYIFAHAVPEVVPFLLFALTGGAIPLPLTVLQILAIDLGTETLPALALGREPAEPGLMGRPPRAKTEGVITKRLLWRAWALMGSVSAVLALLAFFVVLLVNGWHLGDPTGPGTVLHHAYLQATTATFTAIVACQLGTAFAARTEWSSLSSIGLTTNKLLLGGCAFELVFTAALIYVPPLQDVFNTAALPAWALLMMVPFPFLVWGIDELSRWRRRRTG